MPALLLLNSILDLTRGSNHAWATPAERQAVMWLGSHTSPWLDAVFVPLSMLGEWGICWFLVLGALWYYGRKKPEIRRLAVRFAAAWFVGSVCVLLPLRGLAPRDRPYQTMPRVAQKSLAIKGNSFPSGHAHSAWLAAILLGRRRRLRIGLTLFAVLMCVSRVYCGMHFPLDVLVGGLVGVLVGAAVLRLERPGAFLPSIAPLLGRRKSTPA